MSREKVPLRTLGDCRSFLMSIAILMIIFCHGYYPFFGVYGKVFDSVTSFLQSGVEVFLFLSFGIWMLLFFKQNESDR